MTDGQRHVLIIAYYFPPMGLSGVQRTLKFAKYLPNFGWKPTVLTVGPTGYYAFDKSLLQEVDDHEIEVVRTTSLDPNRIFKSKGPVKMPPEWLRKALQYLGDLAFIPDTKIGWKRKALRAGAARLKRRKFDAIVATAPPQTDFLIGLALKKKSKVPLVLEYRDEWLENPYKYFPTPLHRFLHKRLERKVVRGCDRIVVTHRRVKENLVKRYPFLTYHDVTIVSQGFDPKDFDQPVIPKSGPTDRMRIVHAGTFYGGRNPSVIMHALHNVFKASPHLRGRFELNFAGNMRREDQSLASKLGLQNAVNFLGYLEHRVCVKHLLEADLLWLVLENDFQSPGKLYEYLGARKPVLASVPEGYLRQLIVESQAGVCVEPGDVKGHEEALVELLKQFDQKKLPNPAEHVVEKFNRAALTGVLAKLLETLMDIDRNAITRIEEQTT
ncbi:MAG: glycosyltransferase family 4 protein [Ignavibacteriales bacterium]|nr:glycosyltransferase family 4 protein [Ignavibacteriales bacterium]